MQPLIIIALSAFFLTNLLRRLPYIEVRAMTGVRPWSCNACMSFWTMLPAGFTIHFQGDMALSSWPLYAAASGLCFFLLELLEPKTVELPPPPPPPGAGSE
jgi:hypothetical protein